MLTEIKRVNHLTHFRTFFEISIHIKECALKRIKIFNYKIHLKGAIILMVIFRPILNTPCLPVTGLTAAYFNRLKWL